MEKGMEKGMGTEKQLNASAKLGNGGLTVKERLKTEGVCKNLFEQFWQSYPKKKSKDAALKAFKKRNPDDTLFEEIMTGLEKAKQSSDWLKEGGRFIPHPATWLNAGGWMDEEAEIEGAPYSETTAQNLRVLKDWRPT